MMFNKVFSAISKILDLNNLPLYFSSALHEDIIPILKGLINPEINSLKQFNFELNGTIIYIVRGNIKDFIISDVFVENHKSLIICINNNFLNKDIEDTIKSLNDIYNAIFTSTGINFYPNMSKIFTLFSISDHISNVDISKFNFDKKYNENKLIDMYKNYTIEELFDHNNIFTVSLI